MKKWILFAGLLVILLSLDCCKSDSATLNYDPDLRKFTYETLSDYQKSVINEFIDHYYPAGKQLSELLTDQASIRTITRLAETLLFRNKKGDRETAFQILDWVLKYQDTDSTSPEYGVWRTSVGDDRKDQNWREFIGCDLIIMYEKYQSILPETLKTRIETSLLHAAKGASRRNVSPYYTNISVMSAFLMEYTGNKLNDANLKMAGLTKAKEIHSLYLSNNTFSEFNSPTYYGVTLVGLALWREMAFSSAMREMGSYLEKSLWNQMALFYSPAMKNFCGPFFRGYGMDIGKYNAISGIWISLALDDPDQVPLPGFSGTKYDELSNVAPILHLGISCPEKTLAEFRKFTGTRFLSLKVPNKYPGDTLKNITAFISENYMMGGVWGSRRPWGQIKAGTIHWLMPGNEVGWILSPGDGKTNVKVTQTGLELYLADTNAGYLELFLNQDPASSTIMDGKWEFPGRSFAVKTSLKMNHPEKINQQDFKNLLEISEPCPSLIRIRFSIPSTWDIQLPVIVLTPQI